jgi:hypothetical protein
MRILAIDFFLSRTFRRVFHQQAVGEDVSASDAAQEDQVL